MYMDNAEKGYDLFDINICKWCLNKDDKIICIRSNNIVKLGDDISSLIGVEKNKKLIDSVRKGHCKLEFNNVKISDNLYKLKLSAVNDGIYTIFYKDSDMELKNNFLANVSHEFRTPLSGILGMVSLLKDTNLNIVQKEYVNLLEEAGYNLVELVNDILDYSNLDNNNLRVDLNQANIKSCIEESISTVSMRAEKKKIAIEYLISRNVPVYVLSDYSRIKQVLINILSNAITFSDRGIIKITVTKVREYIKFSIKDDGIGIKQDDMGKLFVSFSQIDNSSNRKHQGTGLGLAICEKIVKLLGGTIHAESIYGKGTIFHFTIKYEDTNISNKIEDAGALKGKRVLIVDDNEANRVYLLTELINKNMEVVSCSSSKEALIHIESRQFDIAILDIRIPEVGGVELNDIIKEKNENIITIGVSSAEHVGDVDKFDSYMLKPIRSQNLFKKILELIRDECTEEEIYHKFVNSKVLIVEDIYMNQRVLVGYLSSIGFSIDNIDIADNGVHGLEKINKKRYDIVLLDHKMPVMDGVECFENIKKLKGSRPKVVMVTAMVSKPEVYTDMGMDGYILKPIERGDLEYKLNALLC